MLWKTSSSVQFASTQMCHFTCLHVSIVSVRNVSVSELKQRVIYAYFLLTSITIGLQYLDVHACVPQISMSRIIEKKKFIENQKPTLWSIIDWCCLPSVWFSLDRFYQILSVLFVDTANLIWFIPRFMPVSAENCSFTYWMLFNIFWINIHIQLIIDSAACRNVTIRHFLFHNSIQIWTCEFIFNIMVQ